MRRAQPLQVVANPLGRRAMTAMGAALLLSLGSHASLLAQSLPQLYQQAQAHDAAYQAALANSVATGAKADQAKAAVLPTAQLTANLGRSHTDNNPEVGAGSRRASTDSRLQISGTAPLYRPAAWASKKQGQLQAQTVPVLRQQAAQDLALRVGTAYFEVLNAQSVLATLAAQKTATLAQLQAAKRTFELGSSTITDVHEAQARFDLVQANTLAAQNDLQVAQSTLAELTGQPTPAPHALKPNASLDLAALPPVQQWVDWALAEFPTVQLAQATRDVAQEELTKARAAHGPTVDATASLSRNQAHNSPVQASDVRNRNASLGVLLTVPLFNGYATEARVHETLALLEKAEQDLKAAKRNVAQAVRTQYATLQSQLAQINALQAALTSSTSALKFNQFGYQVGVRINIDVLNSQSQLYSVERDLAKARHNLLLGQLRLKQLAGRLTAADLDQLATLMVPAQP